MDKFIKNNLSNIISVISALVIVVSGYYKMKYEHEANTTIILSKLVEYRRDINDNEKELKELNNLIKSSENAILKVEVEHLKKMIDEYKKNNDEISRSIGDLYRAVINAD